MSVWLPTTPFECRRDPLGRRALSLKIIIIIIIICEVATHVKTLYIQYIVYYRLQRAQCCGTLRPRLSSFSERRISLVSAFIRSHSWKATVTYGVRSSSGTLPCTSAMLKSSGSFSMQSSRIPLICKNPSGRTHYQRRNGGTGVIIDKSEEKIKFCICARQTSTTMVKRMPTSKRN